MSNPVFTVESLGAHFIAAVDLMRAEIDPLLLRNHLLALIFLKRVSDEFQARYDTVYARELARGSAESEAASIAGDPDEHRFFVPPEARWPQLLAAQDTCVHALATAYAALAQRNPIPLMGVFNQIHLDAAVKDLGPEAANGLLYRLLQHFDAVKLLPQHFLTGEVFHQALAHVLNYFAQLAGKRAGDFASPPAIMRLLVELLQPQEGMRVCDPVCGAGGGLAAFRQYLAEHACNPQNLSLYGEELEAETLALCQLQMLLHGLADVHLKLGDTMRDPILDEEGRLMTFDLLLAHPPLPLLNWNYEEAEHDSWQRFADGVPPQKRGDLAFVQHALAALNQRGRAAIIVPHGALFRTGVEKDIRAALLHPQRDVIEAVIGLPSGLGYGASLPFAVLILNRSKPKSRHGKVLFIDAASRLELKSMQEGLQEADLLKLVAAYRAFGSEEKMDSAFEQLMRERRDNLAKLQQRELENSAADADRKQALIDYFEARRQAQAQAEDSARNWLAQNRNLAGFAAVATFREIETRHDFNLMFSRYISGEPVVRKLDIAADLKALRDMEMQRQEAEEEMDRLLAEWGSV